MPFPFRRRGLTPAVLPPVPVTPPPATSSPAPTTCLVTYDRVGEWGRSGKPAPAPLSVPSTSRADIEAAIRSDVRSYLPPSDWDAAVIVDLACMVGLIRLGGASAGSFSLCLLPRGDR